MSKTTITAYIVTALEGMSGLGAGRVHMGRPETVPIGDAPIAIVEAGEPKYTPLTFSAGGSVGVEYAVTITLILGGEQMQYKDAQSAALVWADRLRALFAPDWTLGGNAYNSDLGQTTSNLDTYRDPTSEDVPLLTFVLNIEEITAANSAAS